jgi:parallel beta-helix repeat protein
MPQIIPTNGMVITENTTFAPGVYHLPNGIQIGASNLTIEGADTTFINNKGEGVAIHADGHSNLTIRNLTIYGYYHGVRVENGEDITLEQVTVRDTAEIHGIETFLYLWKPIAEAYSGAILLHNIKNSTVRECDVQHQMNGILLYDCDAVMLDNNNGSFNSGWGIYLSHTNNSTLISNRVDFCNRVYRHTDGVSRVEADAAGIVMVNGSSHNKILKNSCLCGGDGIFLCGYEHPGNLRPCNHNLFEDNDCRLSPNNAIEATFSANNIFRRNDCSRSNYGFWMGYSWDNELHENHVEFNRWVGIAIEHGFGFTIANNTIAKNGEGMRLWTRGGGSVVIPYYPAHSVPHNFDIRNNRFEHNNIGFNGYTGDDTPNEDSHHFILSENSFTDNRIGVRFGRVQACEVSDNTFARNVEAAIQLAGQPDVEIGSNQFEKNTLDTIIV